MTKAWLAKCPATPPEESGDNRRVPLIDGALDRVIKKLLPFVSLGFRDALPRLITRFYYTLQIQGKFLESPSRNTFSIRQKFTFESKTKREKFILHKRGSGPGNCQKVGAAHYVGWEYGPQVVRWCLARCHSLTSPACCLCLHLPTLLWHLFTEFVALYLHLCRFICTAIAQVPCTLC